MNQREQIRITQRKQHKQHEENRDKKNQSLPNYTRTKQ